MLTDVNANTIGDDTLDDIFAKFNRLKPSQKLIVSKKILQLLELYEENPSLFEARAPKKFTAKTPLR